MRTRKLMSSDSSSSSSTLRKAALHCSWQKCYDITLLSLIFIIAKKCFSNLLRRPPWHVLQPYDKPRSGGEAKSGSTQVHWNSATTRSLTFLLMLSTIYIHTFKTALETRTWHLENIYRMEQQPFQVDFAGSTSQSLHGYVSSIVSSLIC